MDLLRHHPRKPARSQEWVSGPPFDFTGGTAEVAQRLVGATLLRRVPAGHADKGLVLRARIVETEAYLPLVDPACHAYRGPTPRTKNLFGRPGASYVYFIYGNHFCLNVVTEPPGIGAAVLIRAAEPVEGLAFMRARRPGVPDEGLLSGPGNLCRAMAISLEDDGVDLRSGDLRIEAGASAPIDLARGPRIGISVAIAWPLRYFDAASASVSPYRRRPRTKWSASR